MNLLCTHGFARLELGIHKHPFRLMTNKFTKKPFSRPLNLVIMAEALQNISSVIGNDYASNHKLLIIEYKWHRFDSHWYHIPT